jgi:TonB family protein
MALNIISIAIAIALLWAAYRLLFINSNRLIFNRAFLIIALGFSLILPAAGFYIGRSTPQIVSYRQSLFQGIMLDEVVITAEGVAISTPADAGADNESAAPVVAKKTAPVSLIRPIGLIWLIGAIGAALVFLFKLGKIIYIIIRSPKKKMPGYTAVFTGKEHGSYSFFNYAFFPDENVSEEIVRHEMSHIAHHHSADILFVELMMIIQWFNPFIYLYKRELQSLHEYMADRDVVATGIDKQNYMMLILQQCTAVDFSNMSNNFSFLLTKKRIKMITQSKKAKGVVIKALLTLPLFALLLFANCKSNGNEKPADKKAVEATETVETQAVETVVNDDSEVYGAVEVFPEYPGGTTAMFEFIQKNLKYPESAKEKGLEGRVFIGFVVEKDGSLSSFQVLRGVCDEIDAEAVRVLKMMPKWKPGMNNGEPVRVQYTMPFKFQLTGNENTMTALSGTHWMGSGTGYKDGSKFVMDMTMDFYNNNDGLFVMKLMAQDQDGKTTPQTVFEDVGLDFTYSFDGKSAGSIQPKNTDGSTLGGEDQQPYSFVMKDGKIIVSFYDFKEDIGIETITFVKK